MEEIEISSWATLDALKKAADIVETVGNLHSDQEMSVFCVLEEDYLELGYSLAGNNYLRHYADEDELAEALEKRTEGLEVTVVDDEGYDEDLEDEDLDFDDESDDL